MVQGHQEAQWNHTSCLRALIFPIAAFIHKEPLDPDLFHPLKQKKKQAAKKSAFQQIKGDINGNNRSGQNRSKRSVK